MKKKSEEEGLNLASCEEILHKVQRNAIELTDKATGCVSERIDRIGKDMVPMRQKFTEASDVLSELMKAIPDCIRDPKTSTARNVACLTDVSVL